MALHLNASYPACLSTDLTHLALPYLTSPQLSLLNVGFDSLLSAVPANLFLFSPLSPLGSFRARHSIEEPLIEVQVKPAALGLFFEVYYAPPRPLIFSLLTPILYIQTPATHWEVGYKPIKSQAHFFSLRSIQSILRT